jgi:hypothetical protein
MWESKSGPDTAITAVQFSDLTGEGATAMVGDRKLASYGVGGVHALRPGRRPPDAVL